jgi:hypothetical protein
MAVLELDRTAQQALCHTTSQAIAARHDFPNGSTWLSTNEFFPARRRPTASRAVVAGASVLNYRQVLLRNQQPMFADPKRSRPERAVCLLARTINKSLRYNQYAWVICNGRKAAAACAVNVSRSPTRRRISQLKIHRRLAQRKFKSLFLMTVFK